MINKYLVIILIALLALPFSAAQAANEVTFAQDTTLNLTSPSTNVTVLADSIVDSLTTAASSINVTISNGGLLKLRSTDRYILETSNVANIAELIKNCTDSYYDLTINPSSSASANNITVTVSRSTCVTTPSSSGATSSSGGSSPNNGSTTTTTTTTTTEETTVTTETPATETTNQTTAEIPSTSSAGSQVSTIPGVPATDSSGKVTIEQQAADATAVAAGDVSQVIATMGVSRNAAAEANYNKTIVASITKGAGATAAVSNTITNFVTYGTPATKDLGAGERGGVVNSYRAAFGKLPATTDEWTDVIKIANGRWPSQTNATAEKRAKTSFKTIYLREASMSNAHDNAAVTVMAYGLRPADRNLNSEKTAIKSFKAIFGYNPTSATNWDAVRAIAYSGATR